MRRRWRSWLPSQLLDNEPQAEGAVQSLGLPGEGLDALDHSGEGVAADVLDDVAHADPTAEDDVSQRWASVVVRHGCLTITDVVKGYFHDGLA